MRDNRWRVVLALPGGGWRWVRREDLGARASSLARYGFVVAVADYTFAADAPPSKSWPRNFEDVREAVRWLRRNAVRLGIDTSRFAALGESAGGHLAALLGTYPEGPVPSDSLPPSPQGDPLHPKEVSARVQAVVDFYGPTNLDRLYHDAPRDRPHILTFLGATPDREPTRYQAASPVNHASADDPPFLIFQGMNDASVPFSQSVELNQALKQAGVPTNLHLFEGAEHGFSFLKGKTRGLLPIILDFLNETIGPNASTAADTGV